MPKKKILFVDDEDSLTRLIKLNLEATGMFDVMTENKGSHALQAAQEFNPDMIFMDVIMPDMEGTTAAHMIREDPLLGKIPIVFLTATISAEDIINTDGVINGETFLAKPATVEEIISMINHFLS